MVVVGLLKRDVLAVTVAVVAALAFGAPAARAEALSPWWSVTAGSRPTDLNAGGAGQIVLTAQNLGDASTTGVLTISDALPAGLHPTAIKAIAGEDGGFDSRGPVSCELRTLTCTFGRSETTNQSGAKEVVFETLRPYEQIEVEIAVSVAGAVSGEHNTVTVSGGGAVAPASASHAIEVDGRERFGFEEYRVTPENAGGAVDTQAGSHPFQLTTVITLDSQPPDRTGDQRTVALAKNVVSELPAGLIADPAPFARCTETQLIEQVKSGDQVSQCPAESALGVATVTFDEPADLGFRTVTTPIFTMTPRPGEPARFGLDLYGVPAYLDVAVRSGGDYGVSIASNNLSESAWLLSLKLTFWGVPGDSRHDAQRGANCLAGRGEGQEACTAAAAQHPPVFLSLPASCEAPFQSTISGVAWNSGEPAEPAVYTLPETLEGCGEAPFRPSVQLTPETTAASTPTGLNVDVHLPQEVGENATGVASADIREIALTLPAGVALDPAIGSGLQACPPDPGEPSGLPSAGFCPEASKIGTAEISTRLLPADERLTGGVYLASQNENPFGSLLAVYVLAEDPISGVLVKLPGEIHLAASGQVTLSFEDTPQLPLEELELHLSAGQRTALATPAHCGVYTTEASFTSWSSEQPVKSSSSFRIASGPNGTPCPGQSLPFSPSLTAGTTNFNAGSFSPLSATISREDGDQGLQSMQLRLPPGLEGLLSAVKPCGEQQANAGTCGPESQIGETTVSAGVGAEPVSIPGGKLYLTEGTPPTLPEGPNLRGSDLPGAPFGLSIATPVKVGPLDLENTSENHPACDCLVIRGRLEVNPSTAALTLATDAGVGGIPNTLDGIPLQIKRIHLTIARPGGAPFMFNPTSCAPQSIAGTIVGAEGASVSVSDHFQVGDCESLAFKPKLTASTAGKTSSAKGASLKVKLTFPTTGAGASGPASPTAEANLKSLKIDLPKVLPARLTTLQGACRKAQFAANPAGCPASSAVGRARVITPVLPVPFEGPAYFVSNGGEALPDLEIVLQGDGVTLDLVGNTFIENKKNLTSATFKTLPDVPLSSFELSFPEGKYSAFGTDKNLCKQKLAMPTALTGQNGAVVHASTKVGVMGCPKPRKAHKAAKGKQPH
jgi:hypothetical protein